MLSLLKKRSEAEAAVAPPGWHPNFRNYEKLPDIKVVRTAFFVNGAAIFVALALGVYAGLTEWQAWVLRGQVAEEQRKVDRDRGPSDQAVAMFKKFQAEESRVNEVDAFIKSKPLLSALLLRLGSTLPPDIAIDSLDLRADGLALRLSLRGDAVAASGRATQYLEQLRADQELGQFEEFAFTATPVRNPATGFMVVEFFLRLKAPATGGKKK
jgi:alkanesulfonate monooxygenase SsuD/methylene tetrahydromethanopterin reductase-like flavin-dependent oxidoreductase (luciferase family)